MSRSTKSLAGPPTTTTAGTNAPGVREVPYGAPPPKKGQKLTRKGAVAGSVGQAVTFANRWRENYNPFRGFTIALAVQLIEQGQRGDTALLQWTYRKLERVFPTLSALISRCEAPLLNYKWDIKIRGQLPDGYTTADAEKQQETLRTAYEAVDNLKEAIRHLHLADFREYSHIQKHRDGDGEVYHLECLDQWLVCKDGMYGDWFWNPDSKFLVMPEKVLGEANRIGGDVLPMEDFIIRLVPRPLDEIALISFTRWALVNRNWDAFIEIYGIPGGVVTMPANVPQGAEAEFQESARRVAEGGSGAIPNGSTYQPNDSPRGTDPFTPRIRALDEDLVMAGTGGRMSMLNAASGLGGGNQGETQNDVFEEIAEARASDISELFQRNFDAEVLSREHPGEPAMAYFELAPAEDVDVDGLIKNVVTLAGAGFKADVEWLNEQTGYELSDAPEEKEDIRVNDAVTGDEEADEAVDREIQNRLSRLAGAGDDELEREFALFNRDYPALGRILNGDVSGHEFHGNQYSGGFGMGQGRELSREEQRQSIEAALRAADGKEQKILSLGTVPQSLANRVLKETGGRRNIAGKEMRITSDFVRHARRGHPDLTDADFHAIPEHMAGAEKIEASSTEKLGLPAVKFTKLGGQGKVLVGAAMNRKGHFDMTTLYKKGKAGRQAS